VCQDGHLDCEQELSARPAESPESKRQGRPRICRLIENGVCWHLMMPTCVAPANKSIKAHQNRVKSTSGHEGKTRPACKGIWWKRASDFYTLAGGKSKERLSLTKASSRSPKYPEKNLKDRIKITLPKKNSF